MTKLLSPVQKKILDYLLWKKDKDGIPPTLAEIAEHFGYKNRSTVKQHLEALHKKKYIRKIDKINRGIEILKKTFSLRVILCMVKLPPAIRFSIITTC